VRPAIAVMAKAPLAGLCKTRLAPLLGAERAAEVHRCFLLDRLELTRGLGVADVSVVCPDEEHAAHLDRVVPAGVEVVVQEGGDLMAGLASTFASHLARGYDRVVLVDADSPTLPPGFINDALERLEDHDVVLGPCDDGGYYLIGSRAEQPALFSGVSYRGDVICQQTAERARELGLSVSLVGTWHDVDTPDDFERLIHELRTSDAAARHTRAYLARLDAASQPDPWTHCHYCGAPLGERLVDGRARQACAACDKVIYRNPVPGAGCVVEHQGKVLLARRRYPPWQGHWYFPSGFVEYDEDVEVTAVREIREETGLEVALDGVFAVRSYFDDPRKNGIIILFCARVVGGELRASDDVSEVAFFAPDALPEPIAFASHRRMLREWAEDQIRGGIPHAPRAGIRAATGPLTPGTARRRRASAGPWRPARRPGTAWGARRRSRPRARP
jgi:rSAM/selenodomain-associated transferase 1